ASIAARWRSSWAYRAPSRRPSGKGPCRRCTSTRRDSSTSAAPGTDAASSGWASPASVRIAEVLTSPYTTGAVRGQEPADPRTGVRRCARRSRGSDGILRTRRETSVRTVRRSRPQAADHGTVHTGHHRNRRAGARRPDRPDHRGSAVLEAQEGPAAGGGPPARRRAARTGTGAGELRPGAGPAGAPDRAAGG